MALFLPVSYSRSLVILSIMVAVLASYVALDLARRVTSSGPRAARWWWASGSVAMGTGIWSMHFVGMMAFSLPVAIGYDPLTTGWSWLAAVAVSGIALQIASRPQLRRTHLLVGALAMGAGICAMHYTGMFAMQMLPGIVWAWGWVLVSALIAVGASLASLLIFFWMRTHPGGRVWRWQIAAALVMGAAIAGMHYSGMMAAHFPPGSICRASSGLRGSGLGVLVGLGSLTLLGVTLLASIQDARLQSHKAKWASSLQEANQALTRIAFQDPLTKLANLLRFQDRLEHCIAQADRQGHRVCLLFVDLDGFKPVNDTLGHPAGDEVLRLIAARLLTVARSTDTVARIGGDEFVVLMEQVDDRASASLLAERLIESIKQVIELDAHELMLSASVGIAVYPDDSDAARLMPNADAAMYHAKQAGKGTYRYYSSEMDAGSERLLDLQRDLRLALNRGEFLLHYQPKVAAATGRLSSVEALLRWQHPERGLVAPGMFIAEAERFGLIVEMGAWVLNEACRQAAEWWRGGARIPVAVNVSALQFRDEALVGTVQQVLQRYALPPEMLTLELTESVAMNDVEHSLRILSRFNELGVKIAIDDFGTGYSSLAYLRRFTPQELKIDRSFVQDIETDTDARVLVGAIIQLAHALGLSVVAEGVETAGQQALLSAQGCNELQGYLFSRPMPAQMVLSYIATQHLAVRAATV
ncbi:putative signaling protein [Andreprevotia sp. IGB-42]|uniref:putative bifunctional diguanylate cyclase/phosphodiesterase n=1 Tax=Andreprevotia sp. IGB-42 TaxID=2497473 RepID=UPI00135C96A0|nr:EAL domain-containing protein [Andreprevotia sp. IGB-42]KAF0813108.1 putative signaling protein [Andreprevotia sp. IGB-42]